MRNLWRLHVRPYGGNIANIGWAAPLTLCLNRGIIGMGWAVPKEGAVRSSDLDWYKSAVQRQYDDNSWQSVVNFAEYLQLHDLVWFRNLEGRYYLAEIIGPWQYAYDDQALIEADMVNYREARIVEVGLADAVPGKIIAGFRPSKTFQPVRSLGMLAFSEKVAGVPVTDNVPFDVFEFMSDADIENLVFVYLQYLGWYALPGTRTATTAHYEFVLVNRESGERAVVQVKSGHTEIEATRYEGMERAFLFAVSGRYGPHSAPNISIISKDDLVGFMRDMPHLLPRAVATWNEVVASSAIRPAAE